MGCAYDFGLSVGSQPVFVGETALAHTTIGNKAEAAYPGVMRWKSAAMMETWRNGASGRAARTSWRSSGRHAGFQNTFCPLMRFDT